MTIFILYIKADIDGINEIIFPSNYIWCIDIEQSAGPLTKNRITIDPNEKIPIENSRGTANYVMKWDGDKRYSTIRLIELKGITKMKYYNTDNGNFVPIIAFECRGLNPTKWNPTFGYNVNCISGKSFINIDLQENEWCEFDEEANESVGIYNIQSEFRVHK
ncbi:hypothetical protein ACR3K2_38180 [Cryptosporidium serpentis]